MSDFLQQDKIVTFFINKNEDHKTIEKICRALSIEERIKILKCILTKSKSLKEISEETSIPFSSVARHVDVLEDAQLLVVNFKPGKKKHTKYCSQTILGFNVSLDVDKLSNKDGENFKIEMPVGMFSECEITKPCGMVGKDEPLVSFDNPALFYTPRRREAECVWFNNGFLSYIFPNPIYERKKCSELSLSLEICSEAVYYNENWPSDISFYLNGKKVLTFTSPGDFGGRRGEFTPEYWPISSTQFGLLKTITVNKTGIYLDKILIDDSLNIDDFKIDENQNIILKIGIEKDAVHQGGINLFGKNFGDYQQAIMLTLK